MAQTAGLAGARRWATAWPADSGMADRLLGGRPFVRLGGGGIAAALVGQAFAVSPRPGLEGRGLAVSAALVAIVTGALTGRRAAGERRLLLAVAGLAVAMGASAALRWVSPDSLAPLGLYVPMVWAVRLLPAAWALPLAAGGGGAFSLVHPAGWLGWTGSTLGILMLGVILRQEADGRAQAARLYAEEQAARTAEAQVAVLDERARIAREIHDILAHSLSAQVVQLEAAGLMIESGADPDAVLERVRRAQRTAREGLVEARHAVAALRSDPGPLPVAVRALAEESEAAFRLEGEPRALGAEAALAVRRTAQEALTNARRHAHGAAASVTLRFGDGWCELEVENPTAAGATAAAPSAGSGFGLAGLRERAALLGGSLDSGPVEEGGAPRFRVRLRIPT